MEKIKLDPIFDRKASSKNFIFVNCSTDYKGQLNILFVEDRYDNKTDNGMFFKIVPDKPQNYELITLINTTIKSYYLKSQSINYTSAFQINGNSFLFACGRSHYKNKNDYDKNCKIFDQNGKKIREFCIGDGIQEIQTNKNSEIWVSYFPIGKSGLICFDINGNICYEYKPMNDNLFISDCYALNVFSENEVYIYFYTEFFLLKILNKQIDRYWKFPIIGSDTIVISGNKVLSDGGYDKRQDFILFEVNKKIKKLKKYRFITEKGELLSSVCHSQKDKLFFWNDNKLYSVCITDLF